MTSSRPFPSDCAVPLYLYTATIFHQFYKSFGHQYVGHSAILSKDCSLDIGSSDLKVVLWVNATS